MLSAADPLPFRPSRVLVAGTSGSGKTSLAATIAITLVLPHTEIDALFHGPGWVPRPSFETEVAELAAGPGWVTEWQYEAVRGVLVDRSELLVWLDLSRAVVMMSVTRRTLRRRLGRVELWNGNREPGLRTIFSDPDHIIRWAWSHHASSRERVLDLHRRRPGLPLVRLASRREVRRWVAGPLQAVARSSAGGTGEGPPQTPRLGA